MRPYRVAVVGVAVVAMVAGGVALVAATAPDAQTFADGFDASASHTLRGPILERYRSEGGPGGPLGLPISDEQVSTFQPFTRRGADREVGFRHGAIYVNSRTGETWFGVWVASVPPAARPWS